MEKIKCKNDQSIIIEYVKTGNFLYISIEEDNVKNSAYLSKKHLLKMLKELLKNDKH